ncbi:MULTISPECIES: DNA-dependent RNA polymerase subunit epsilon [Evansella]|jgi:DNA-dependent RNA polymerase auxiliary subunit epsilon|uniref:DNA-dependent RNA polymerase subunit epsilon n=1 Tax=Evansella TaxID=2837485 RepID=UPI00099716AC|nr:MULTISPECIES: DNA-directed RNA polymerase subunit epsilon [Evansella]UTR11033.1 DNA-dependent RNA polymerase auxiliary subunit epsilon family protein [Evansella sp. LMS18]
MIFKVFYQTSFTEVPVREKTEAMYLEAETEEDVRKKLADRQINIEFVTPLEGEALAYEQQHENFKLENV